MNSPRAKYSGEQDPRYGGHLYWHGNSYGIPFRSPGEAVPLLKQHELENLPIVGDARVALFDLSKPDQMANYVWVRDRIRNRLFTLDFIQRFWDARNCRMLVYIEWTQLYATIPQGSNYGNSSISYQG